MTTVLVTGATGFVGRHLVDALGAAGYDVRCATRAPARARARDPAATWVELDLDRPATLAPALAGCDAAVFLVHAMGPEHAGTDYPERERASAEAFAAAAAAAGLARIVYLGGVMPAAGASRHLRSRERTGAILRAGSVEAIELRAAMIIGAGSASWEMVRDLAGRLPVMVLPRWLRNTSCPIGIADVVHGLVAALALPPGPSRVYELAGPERLTHRDVLRRAAAALGRRRLMISVPILTPRLSSYWIALVTRTPLAMARELVEGVRSDLVPTGASLWDAIGHSPMAIDEAIRGALRDGAAASGAPLRRPAGPGTPARPGDRAAAAGPTAPAAIAPAAARRRASLAAIAIATVGFAVALLVRERVDPWRATALAAAPAIACAAWALGPRLRPLFAGTRGGALAAIALGVALVAATHGAFQLARALAPALASAVSALYASIQVDASRPTLALLTAAVVLGEELVWRGAAIELLAAGRSRLAVGAASTALYLLPQLAGGEPLLIAAAALLGGVFAAQRLRTGRLLDPLLTHAVWSISVFVAVPLV
jgi:uncharacterized protein YbjT (DUF2867 family)/membrane protease YdiL (CAAX protease family)